MEIRKQMMKNCQKVFVKKLMEAVEIHMEVYNAYGSVQHV